MNTRLQYLPADVFGLSDIARGALARGKDFGPIPVPTKVEDIAQPAEFLGLDERRVLVDAIDGGLKAAGVQLPPAARDGLEALRRVGVHCIITGQQPGFLCSPLYSLYKALQACRAARELTELWGTPVVPIFWNHADDHDIAEVHHAWQVNQNLDLQKVTLPGLASGRTPLGEIVIDGAEQSLDAVRALLRGTLGQHEDDRDAEGALDLFLPRDGESLPRALTRIFTELCGTHGLVVCEPDWIRPMLSSELGRIVSLGGGGASGATLVDALKAGEDELTAIGLHAAIPVGDAGVDPRAAAALVYRHERAAADAASVRVALRAGGEGYLLDGESGSRTPAELGSLIVDAARDWSAGAVVRPLVQDAVFPTCAYVGGFGELGYHAQLGPARDALGQPRTPFLPRVSMTVVDGDTLRALQRLEVDLETVLRAQGEFRPADVEGEDPAVVAALRQLGEDTRARLLEHRADLARLEPALAITLKKTAQHVQQSIGKVIDKALRVHKNSSGKGARHVRRVNSTLVPRGMPQERVLGPFAFVARHGREFVDVLWDEMPGASTEHIALYLEDNEGDDS